MTSYNRAATTLECLHHLFEARVPAGWLFDVWLNDDASPDGTGVKVRIAFPRIKVIKGSGRDFWCGGMRRVWSAAATSGIKYDGYFWLNDDTMLFDSALEEMLVPGDSIIVGATFGKGKDAITYSGRDESGSKLMPNGELQACYWMNGNAVYVPHSVFSAIGNFPGYMTHGIGDYDYGLRARENGIEVLLAAHPVGICEAKTTLEKWRNPEMSFWDRLRNLYSPAGGPEPHVFFRYNLSHFGLRRAVRLFLGQHFRVLFPKIHGGCNNE
ncbi:MAG: glycosyltransferase family 2 protein [Kiritimatiellia bacterium]